MSALVHRWALCEGSRFVKVVADDKMLNFCRKNIFSTKTIAGLNADVSTRPSTLVTIHRSIYTKVYFANVSLCKG